MNDQTSDQTRDQAGDAGASWQASREVVALLGPGAVLAAQEAGQRAAWEGNPVTACPWPAGSDDPRVPVLRQMWARGYAAGRTDLRTARATAPQGSDAGTDDAGQ
jgi:hypothetical protein